MHRLDYRAMIRNELKDPANMADGEQTHPFFIGETTEIATLITLN